jgi:D-alanine-D-alanine ligase
VLSGGRSSEHEVSLASGAAIRDGLREAGHETIAVEIGRDGVWRRGGEPLAVCPGAGLLGADVAFAALHGPYGEDGTVQGMLETLDIPYVGAGVAGSAVCMDKVLFKRLLAAGEPALPQVEYLAVDRLRWRAQPRRVGAEVAALSWPVFVKPAHLGSSVGIVKVAEPARLAGALERALAHDELAIVEAAAPGIEVECGVLGLLHGPARGDAHQSERTIATTVPTSGPAGTGADATFASVCAPALVAEPGEIVFAGEFYDYDAKYTPGGMELVVPARISATARARVQELALRAFAHVGCEGLARVDFFVDGESVLVNELNTMPGFTPTSVYAKLMAASGVPYPELLDRLCRLGIERHERRRALRH